MSNLIDYVDAILELPSLKSLNIISNGFNTDKLLKDLEAIYSKCKAKEIHFSVSISLDGVGIIHDKVRGILGAFKKTITTIDKIKENQGKYCDSFEIACTITKHNIDYLMELDAFCKLKGYKVKYRLGVDIERIDSNKNLSEYSILMDNKLMQTAKEFFHYKMTEAEDLYEKFRYFSLFYYLNSDKPKRLLGCMWKDEGITLDSEGNIYYCAVRSKSIGNLRFHKGKEIFFNNIEYRNAIVENYCNNCIHDYSGKPELSNVLEFLKFLYKERFATKLYELKLRIEL